MEVINTRYKDKVTLAKFIKEKEINDQNLLVQVFTSNCNPEFINRLTINIKSLLPAAKIIGATTAGEIIEGEMLEERTIISFTTFEHTSLQVIAIENNDKEYFASGVQLGKELISDHTKAMILFSDSNFTNSEELIKGIEEIDNQVVVAGGKAGDNLSFENTYVFTGNKIINNGAVGVSLTSQKLQVFSNYNLGWQKIGKTMTITQANKNKIYKIDKEAVDKIYARYLGEEIATNLSYSAVTEFPLIFNKNGTSIARAVTGRNEDGSFAFSGNLKEGEEVQFGYGNVDLILNNAFTLVPDPKPFPIEGIYIYSCGARKSLLQQDIELELKPLQQQAPTVGFFTHGEFYHQSGTNQLFNATTTILALSEQTSDQVLKSDLDFKLETNNVDKRSTSMIKGLTNLVDTVTTELEEKNQQLELVNKKINSNCNLEETCQAIIEMASHQLDAMAGAFILKNDDNSLEIRALVELNSKYLKELLQIVSSHNFIKEVFYDQEPVIIDQLKNQFSYNRNFTIKDDFKSLIAVPIIVGDQVEGTLILFHSKEGFFEYQNLSFIQTIIDQAPLMIEKARTFERLERKVAELSILQETSNKITSSLDEEEVFTSIVDVIMGTMGVSMSGLFLLEEDRSLELVASQGINTGLEKKGVIEITKDLCSQAVKKQQIYRNYDIKLGQFEYTSFIAVPLQIRNQVIGAIIAGQIGFKRSFSTTDETFLKTLANQVAIGIENAKMYKEQEEMVIRDGLTGLYNHSYFQDRLQEEINKDQQLALLMLDIDDFKQFNDTFGHQAGDEILKLLAEKLQTIVRNTDIVARYGGEEFAVILPQTSLQDATNIGVRIKEELAAMKIEYNDLRLNVTASIGIANYKSDKSSVELIKEADDALYKAKNRGKNRVCN